MAESWQLSDTTGLVDADAVRCQLLALRVTYRGAAIRPVLGAKRKRPARQVAEADSRRDPLRSAAGTSELGSVLI
jgi:hypothetical protein